MKRLAIAAIAAALAFPSAAGAARLQVLLPLKADDSGLRAFATAVSTPGSPLYGHFQSVAALARRFGARAGTQAAVVRYLRSAGATGVSVSPTGMYVQARINASRADRTLTKAARLPAGALGVVGLDTRPVVRPIDSGAPPSGYLPASGTPRGCPGGVGTDGFTPSQYLTAYGYDPLHGAGLRGRGQRIALIEIDGFKPSDLRTFAHCFSLAVPPISTYGVGTARPLAPGPESTLDLEMLDAAAPHAGSFEVFESGSDAVAVDQAFAAPLVTPGAKPQVVTASIGLCEQAIDSAFGTAGILAVERNLELAAATGITMVVAAGDTGSADCSDPQGDVLDGLGVDYPSASPWVTSVGGTNVRLDPANRIISQEVWNDAGTQLVAGGGGFSRLFLRPAYQNGVVAQNSRAVPDVSMLADIAPGYAIFCTAVQAGCDGWRSVGGTSAAAPLVGGGLALIDQDLAAHGRKQIGWANPLLYAIGRSAAGPSVFSDVIQGSNDVGPSIPSGDGQPLGCCSAGGGFDAASGWGSINLARLDRVAGPLLPKSPTASISIPGRQQPVKAGRLMFRLTCTKGCKGHALGFASVAGGATLNLRSADYRFRRAGTKLLSIRFSAEQERQLAAAVAKRKRIAFELFGAALTATGSLGNVGPGRELVII